MSDQSDDKQWLQIGKSFPSQFLQEEKVDSDNEKHGKNEKKKKKEREKEKKEKKKQKLNKKSQQIVIKLSQQDIEKYYDDLIEESIYTDKEFIFLEYNINTNQGFIYRHDVGPNLLTIQLLPFGFQDIYTYGHPEKDVPSYRRVNCNMIIGLKSDDQTKALLQELAIPLAQQLTIYEKQIPRFYEIPFPSNSFFIQSFQPISNEDFIPFNNKLDQLQIDYKQAVENSIIRRGVELQQMLQQDVNNLDAWKELLELQTKQAILQNYNEETIIATKKLAIIEKLEKASEVLADHPWVLAQKISIMQNLQIKDVEFQRQITNLQNDLFMKYQHIQPIWILNLDSKLKTEKFNVTAVRLEAQNHISNLKQLISESKRPQMINFYKQIYLELIQQISFYEWEMGFRERGIGIYQSLCEANIFAPKELLRTSDFTNKLNQFQAYWEDVNTFRTGELFSKGGWKDWKNLEIQSEEFIGNYHIKQTEKLDISQQSPVQRFLQNYKEMKYQWRPLNPNLDDYENNLDGLVLFDDIAPYLHLINDNDSKLKLISGLLEQLGFPSFGVLPSLNSNFEAQACYNSVKRILKDKQNESILNLIFQNDCLMKYELLFQNEIMNTEQIEKLMYIRRILNQLSIIIPNEQTLVYIFVIESVIYLQKDKIIEYYQKEQKQSLNDEIVGSFTRLKQILKQYGEKYIVLWVLFAEIEFKKRQNIAFADKIFEQTLQFIKEKTKKKMICLYFWMQFHLFRTQQIQQVMKIFQVILQNDQFNQKVVDDDNNSFNVILIKIKRLYQIEKNKQKLNSMDYIEKYKTKPQKQFPLSKKSIYKSFVLIGETLSFGQNYINQESQILHFEDIIQDLKLVNNMSFSDQFLKPILINQYSSEMQFTLLNYLRSVYISPLDGIIKRSLIVNICQAALKNDKNSFIFFTQLINQLQLQWVYFEKIEKITKQIEEITYKNFLQAPHKCWIAEILLFYATKTDDQMQKRSKFNYLIEFLKQQSEKQLSQIYCEHDDQEIDFNAFINIAYNYYLDQIQLLIEKNMNNQENLIKRIHRILKNHPFSIDLYAMLLKQEQKQEETLNILNVIEEKELKAYV